MTLQIQEINQYDITNSIFKIASIINKETIQLDYFLYNLRCKIGSVN